MIPYGKAQSFARRISMENQTNEKELVVTEQAAQIQQTPQEEQPLQTLPTENSAMKRCLDAVKGFLIKYEFALLFIAITIMTMLVRFALFDGRSGDYNGFLSEWFNTIKAEGPLKALGHKIGDYTPAYFYILTILTFIPVSSLVSIKFVSCIFDIVLAIAVCLCVKELTKSKWKTFAAYAIVLLMPSVFLNSGAWAQCDSIFTSFCIWSLYFLLKKKNVTAVIMYGIAFAFKLQAIFMAPLFAVMWFKGKIPLWSPLLVVGVYVLFCVPSWLCGRSLWSLLTVYFDQAGSYRMLTLFATTFVALFGKVSMNSNSHHVDRVSTMLIMLALTVTILLIYLCARKTKWKRESAIDFAYLFCLIVPFFLPHMHERYFYLATLVSIVYSFLHPKRIYAAAISEFCAFYVVCNHLYTINYLSLQIVTMIQVANIVLLLRDLWKDYIVNGANENA